ncbi:MAG: ankyrin repeat domain-containing protein [Acidobacteriota bacterium]|jgi:hypothetical protein
MTTAIRFLLCVGLGAVAAGAPSPTSQQPAAGAALRAAASHGNLTAVTDLLAAGVPVDDANEYGATPLILAAMNGRTEVVRALLDAGADPTRTDTFYRRTPLQWATSAGTAAPEELLSMLFLASAGDYDALFLEAVDSGDADQVARLLGMQTPDDEVLSEALDHAMRDRNEQVAQLLMGAGAVPPMPEVVAIDAARLRMYEGRYVDDVGYELVIIADQQTRTLLVRPPGVRNPLRFVPVEETTFIAQDTPNIYIRFTVRDGRVVSMSFTQPGVTRRMNKQ